MDLKILDLFSGIGGFSYAAERIVGGYETTQFVEIDSYCQSVLRKNFPNTPIHDDIKTFTAKRGEFDVLTAGFPCQDLSVAGRQKGIGEGTRSGLFYEIIRLLGEIQPKFVLFENVRNLLSHEKGVTFQEILFQIAKAGYDAEWSVVSAKDLGACHKRERLWIIAYPFSDGVQGRLQGSILREREFFSNQLERSEVGSEISRCSTNASNSNSDGSSTSERIRIDEKTSRSSQKREKKISKSKGSSESRGRGAIQQITETQDFTNSIGNGAQSDCEGLETPIWTHAFLNSKERRTLSPDWQGYVSEPSLCRGDDGLSNRVARIKALGNSIVPNCAAVPLQRIKDLIEEKC